MKNEYHCGSAIVEVTMIMSLVLMILFLLLTMLLGGWQQAQAHAGLMLLADRSERQQEEKCETENGRIVYSESVHIEIVKGYSIDKTEYQIERQTETEEKLRRWQIFGDAISDGGLSSMHYFERESD